MTTLTTPRKKKRPAKKPRVGQMSGPPAQYRGKDRHRVITFTMTPDGHAALERLQAVRKCSRADLLEGLIRAAAGA